MAALGSAIVGTAATAATTITTTISTSTTAAACAGAGTVALPPTSNGVGGSGSGNSTARDAIIRSDVKYLHMSLNLLTLFASGDDKSIKMDICSDENIEILVEMLELLSAVENDSSTTQSQDQQSNNNHFRGLLHKLVTIFRFLSSEHNLLNKLENFGLIPKVLRLLDAESRRVDPATRNLEFFEDLLKIINYF